MPKESAKHKVHTKKSNPSQNSDLDTFLRTQQNIVAQLKTELKSVINKTYLAENGSAEKDKCILQLEKSLKQREAETQKLSANSEQLSEENSRILMELNLFKEKFYQLETDYDKTLNLQYQQQQISENREIEQLSLKCLNLQQNFDQMNSEFELYKKQVKEEQRLEAATHELDLATLREEIKRKDDALKQCLSDKNDLEKEKNLVIDELNNKIFRIERAFSQPSKGVQPMVTLPQPTNNSDGSQSSNENVAISLRQVCNPLENLPVQSLATNENQKVEQNQSQRNYKFKRPLQPPTSSQQSKLLTNIGTQRKRRNQQRQSAAKKNYNEFSLSSSDEDNDNDSNCSSFSQQLWRPNNDCYVADTDASEGFAKAKRSKK